MEEATDSQLVTDPAFLQSVLRNLPGVDPDSEAVQEALGKKDEKKDEEKKWIFQTFKNSSTCY